MTTITPRVQSTISLHRSDLLVVFSRTPFLIFVVVLVQGPVVVLFVGVLRRGLRPAVDSIDRQLRRLNWPW
jgi:hypothetical protein